MTIFANTARLEQGFMDDSDEDEPPRR